MVVLLSLLALAASATAATIDDQITWGAVVLTYHGEKTPLISSNGGFNLSPLGANQALLAGSTIRDRYINPPINGSSITSSAPINGLSSQEIDNTQLAILTTDEEFETGSALAFMQGLYPPLNVVEQQLENSMSNGTFIQYPLGNYQYPNIASVSSMDLNFIWVAGRQLCPAYLLAQTNYLSGVTSAEISTATADFYNSLATTVFSDLDPESVSYYNAYNLYEYALYQYNHNMTFNQLLSDTDLAELYNLASQQQFALNTPSDDNNIPSISGQTFASVVLQQFVQNIRSGGVSDKMSLFFSSYEPFLAFFALSGLNAGPAASRFNTLPLSGSVMTFELFSLPNTTTGNEFPATTDLWVRFLFRNGTESDETLISYSLFGRGNSEATMPWADFVRGMSTFAVDQVAEWCSSCQSVTLFCDALAPDSANPSSAPSTRHGISPAVAGVIGAAIMLIVLLLLFGLLAIVGFRLSKRHKHTEETPGVLRRSSAGGFKGAEKLASDTDLRLKGGASASAHARMGSWELGDSPTNERRNLDKELESGGKVVSNADYGRKSEERMDPFGDPVKAVDQV